MKKLFLLCLSALLCCVTGVWGASLPPTLGEGTQDDPYVYDVENGSEVSLNAGQYGEFHYTAPDGGATLKIYSIAMDPDYVAGFEYKKSTDAEWSKTTLDDLAGTGLELEGGVTYYIRNAVAVAVSDRQDVLTFDITANEEPGGGEEPGGDEEATLDPASGDGTQGDPYVYEVTNGSVVKVNKGDYIRFEFTYDGTGELIITATGWDGEWMQTCRYKAADAADWKSIDTDNGEYFSMTLTLNGFEAGKKYVFENTAALDYEDSQNVTVTFTGATGGEQGGDEPGAGTDVDPIVVKDGSTYVIPKSGQVYAEITVPEGKGGQLKLIQNAFNNLGFGIKEKGSDGEFTLSEFKSDQGGMHTDFTLEGGKTYLIYNTTPGPEFMEITITVSYLADVDNENAFKVIATDPDFIDGELASLKGGVKDDITGTVTDGETFTVTLDKGVAFLGMELNSEKYGNITTTYGEPVGEGEPVLDEEGNPVIFVDRSDPDNTFELKTYKQWKFGPVVGDWVFYNDSEYTATFISYADKNAWYDMVSLATTSFNFKGATAPVVYSDIKLVSLTPEPNPSDVEDMLSTENNVVTFEFDGQVKVEMCAIPLGAGGNINVQTEVDYETVEGHTLVKAEMPVSSSDFSMSLVLKVTDMEGNDLQDEEPAVPGVTWFAGQYSIDFSVADGRTIEALLECNNLNPAENGYVGKLDKVTFNLSGGRPSDFGDSFYAIQPSVAKAELYDAEDNKVCDAVILEKGMPGADENAAMTVILAETGTVNYEVFSGEEGTRTPEYEPYEVTTPGQYTLKIAQMSIGDANFEAASPWMTNQSGNKGRCNPDWAWTFNVVEKIVEVESVDPAPYNVSGEYNEKVPAEVSVKFNDANVTVENVVAMVSPFNSAILTEDDYKLEDGVLTMSIPESMLAERKVTVTVEAVSSEGQPVTYGYTAEDIDAGLSGIMLVYQTPQDVLVPTAVTPEDKSTVTSLADIVLTFGENLGIADSEGIELRDAAGQHVAYGVAEVNFDEEAWAATSLTIRLDDVIDAEGTYTLVIPAENFYNEDESVWNPALEYTFTVDPTFTGISGINVSADEEVKVYTVSGVYVGAGKAGDVLGKLSKGIYIVNGQKVAIK